MALSLTDDMCVWLRLPAIKLEIPSPPLKIQCSSNERGKVRDAQGAPSYTSLRDLCGELDVSKYYFMI